MSLFALFGLVWFLNTNLAFCISFLAKSCVLFGYCFLFIGDGKEVKSENVANHYIIFSGPYNYTL